MANITNGDLEWINGHHPFKRNYNYNRITIIYGLLPKIYVANNQITGIFMFKWNLL